MGLLDDIKAKATEIAKDPATKQKAKDFVNKHKDTIDSVKNRLTKKDGQ